MEATAAALHEARATLSATLQELDARYEPAPKGLSISLGWGFPYFTRYVPRLAEEHLPGGPPGVEGERASRCAASSTRSASRATPRT